MRKKFSESSLTLVLLETAGGAVWFRVATIFRRIQRYTFRGAPLSFQIAVIICPFCAKIHQHGWGEGVRAPHCRETPLPGPGESKDYYLECPNDFPVIHIRKPGVVGR